MPSGRPAIILAALALRPGTSMNATALAGCVWRDGAPANPRAALQTHVTRLRAIMGRDVVVSDSHGYRLDVPEHAVDLFRFRALAADARSASAEAGLAMLEEALALWTGAPLSGLAPDDFGADNAPPIENELLAAAERVGDLHLGLNRAGDTFLRRLRELTAVHPKRERLWEQLMLALYRQGRQGDALAMYHDAVTALRRDYATKPGAGLTTLHERILAADPDLADSGDEPQAVAQPPIPPPAQLPAWPADFVGRSRELAKLTDLLTPAEGASADRSAVAVISGPGGAGKTTLALRVAHEVRKHYVDGQVFVELRGAADGPEVDAPAALLRALGVASSELPGTAEARAGLVRTLCSERRLLIVCDDVAGASDVGALVPVRSPCGFIVTSRRRLPVVPATVHLDLGLFSRQESWELLGVVAGEKRVDAEPEAVKRLLQVCGGSPLAVRIAGGRLASRPAWPIDHLASRLDEGDLLDELEVSGLGVRALLDTSYGGLDPVSAARYRCLAVVPGLTVDTESAASMWDVSTAEAAATLRDLADLRMLEPMDPDGSGRYRWHGLLGEHVRAVADPDETRRARHRLLSYLLAAVHAAMQRLLPNRAQLYPFTVDHSLPVPRFATRADVHAWLHPRQEFIVSLARGLLADGDSQQVDRAATLSLRVDGAAVECCDSGDQEASARSVLDAPVAPDTGLVAQAWQMMTLAMAARSRLDDALYAGTRALEMRREAGDRYGELVMHENVATVHIEAGRYRDALDLLDDLATADDPLPAQVRARSLRTRARAQVGLGLLDRAHADLTNAARIETPEPVSYDAHYEATVEATVYRAAGDHVAAVQACRRAVDVAIALESTWMQALSLLDLARIRRQFEGDGRAEAEAALEVSRKGRHVRWQAEALVELAIAAEGSGDPARAATHQRAADSLFASMGINAPV